MGVSSSSSCSYSYGHITRYISYIVCIINIFRGWLQQYNNNRSMTLQCIVTTQSSPVAWGKEGGGQLPILFVTQIDILISYVNWISFYKVIFIPSHKYRVSQKKQGLVFRGHFRPLNGRKSKKQQHKQVHNPFLQSTNWPSRR